MLFSLVSFFFFFKQKTAYEMRISDWSSDVCSSDLEADLARLGDRPDEPAAVHALREQAQALAVIPEQLDQIAALAAEREQRARVRTLLQHLLHQHREPIEPLAHIGGAAGQIDACRRW